MAEVKTHEDTPNFVPRRNERILNFFRENGFGNDIRIIGDENTPAILYKDEHVLSCHVHNFELKFTDAVFGGNIIKEYKLLAEAPDVREELIRLIQDFPARKVYKLYLESTGIKEVYLCGWNYLNPAEKEGKYPVFGVGKPKVYFTLEKAQELKNELIADGYCCKVI